MQRGVLGDPDHGEDFFEVWAEPEAIDLLTLLACRDHHLDHQRDAAGIQVLHLREIQQDTLDAVR